ncbi:hypothetical protein ODJ79_42455 [Actinoplanes sp. KI2]|uniref:hypothetical protein n=1 Tax=Actinoplanes sp. KI2 TaxID=2983315 RepID=UPI0021D614E3|nr:hypothetical protein [Actinoplanes sp. KI2]MCU7730421.1 hypothetical protein [Actinoplanes sp. KI2]
MKTGDRPSMTPHDELERRYRRLMTAYPRRHRQEYEEEMVAVLLAAAEPGARRPGLRDRADLLVNALAVRLRGWGTALGDDAWRRAAFVVQLVGSLFLLGVGLRRLPLSVAPYLAGGADAVDVARPAVWAIGFAVALAGLRRVAAGVAAAGAIVETVHVARWYDYSPSQVLRSSWLVTVALLVAAGSVWLAGGARVTVPRGLWWFAAALLAAVGGRVADDRQWQFRGLDVAIFYDGRFVFRVGAPFYLTAAGLALWAWWRLGGPVRRRVLALAAPVAAIAAMVAYGFAGFMYSSQRFPSPVLLVPVQWAVLLATPPVAFVLAAALLNRWERLSALVRLGRQAEDASA